MAPAEQEIHEAGKQTTACCGQRGEWQEAPPIHTAAARVEFSARKRMCLHIILLRSWSVILTKLLRTLKREIKLLTLHRGSISHRTPKPGSAGILPARTAQTRGK